MPTIVRTDIQARDLQSAVMQAIGRAFLVIADISCDGCDRFNPDVGIEAGMAIAAGANLELMAAGDSRSPPFMLRGAGQLTTYGGPVDQLGRVRNIAWNCRRRIINSEL
jgi:hypothetical protein